VKLNSEHIDFIIKDLHKRGILLDDLENEIIDHVCSSVEEKVSEGKVFVDAYNEVIESFGSTPGLQRIQKETAATIMFKNYLTTTLRQLSKGKLYTFINTFGLSVAIAACLLIVLYIGDELSYDAYNDKADRIFRVHTEIKFGPNHVKLANGPAPVASTLLSEYPEIEMTCRVKSNGTYLVRPEHESINQREANVIWADSTFFKVFSIPVIAGNPEKALTEAHSFAISRKMAEKYFPGEDPVGKIMILDNNRTGKVTAVFENIPSTSHLHFDILIGLVGDWPLCRQALSQDFLSSEWTTYLVLKEGADAKALEAKLPVFVEKYLGKAIGATLGVDFNMSNFVRDGNKYELTLMSIRDIHLHSDLVGELEANGDIIYVYMFGIIALLILVIACVNFMNLSTARSATRAKEVGVRKVMGSLRGHLIKQFLLESLLISLLSFIIAIAIAWITIPMFNDLAMKDLHLPFLSSRFWIVLAACSFLIGFLAGIYPAFVLSAFRPIAVLKANNATTSRSLLRDGMVVFQFAISILLIVGTITVNRQLGYIQNKKIGFDKSQVIIVKDGYALRPTPDVFKTEALKISSIQKGTMTGHVPIDSHDFYRNVNAIWREGQDPLPENMVNLQTWAIDEDYIPTYGMNIIEGRNFSKAFPSDPQEGIIINQAAAKILNFEGGPVGKRVNTFIGDKATPDAIQTLTIIGVVEDFHFATMRVNIGPLAFWNHKSDGAFSFKFEANKAKETIEALEETWKRLGPTEPFNYAFLDEEFGRMYAAEQRLVKIFELFSGLAIIIACIGLFALTAFTAEQRTKEIGIRKVLGASVGSLFTLLSKEFVILVLISVAIASVLGWLAMNKWLQNYNYHIDVDWWIFLLAGIAAVLITLISVSFQSAKAALMNPIKSLRSE